MAKRLSSTGDQPSTPDPVQASPAGDQQDPAQASGVEPSAEPPQDTPGTPADDSTPDDLGEDLISAEDRASLKNDPVALEKALRRGFTQKTQKMAEMRRQIEPFLPIIQGLQEDPESAIMALAEQVGLKVEKAAQSTEATPALETLVRDTLRESLGEEYEDLAERLTPGFVKALNLGIEQAQKPMVLQQQRLEQEAAIREVQTELEAFDKIVPGWRKYEDAMNKLSAEIKPTPGMSTEKYLRILYNHCAADQAVAQETRRTVDRITQNAVAANREPRPVHADQVAARPPGPLTFAQAAQMAREGRRVER